MPADATDQPNRDHDPDAPDLERLFVAASGRAALYWIGEQPVVVLTVRGYAGVGTTEESRLQVAIRPEDWEATVKLVERMQARSPEWRRR